MCSTLFRVEFRTQLGFLTNAKALPNGACHFSFVQAFLQVSNVSLTFIIVLVVYK